MNFLMDNLPIFLIAIPLAMAPITILTKGNPGPVSYTHLTLPTILRV